MNRTRPTDDCEIRFRLPQSIKHRSDFKMDALDFETAVCESETDVSESETAIMNSKSETATNHVSL